MKKYIFLMGIILLSLIIVSIEPTYGLDEMNYKTYVNSNEIMNYIKENHLENIKKICTNDFCDYLRSTNLEESISIFKKKYQEFLETKIDKETALSIILKGFPITDIETFE